MIQMAFISYKCIVCLLEQGETQYHLSVQCYNAAKNAENVKWWLFSLLIKLWSLHMTTSDLPFSTYSGGNPGVMSASYWCPYCSYVSSCLLHAILVFVVVNSQPGIGHWISSAPLADQVWPWLLEPWLLRWWCLFCSTLKGKHCRLMMTLIKDWHLNRFSFILIVCWPDPNNL